MQVGQYAVQESVNLQRPDCRPDSARALCVRQQNRGDGPHGIYHSGGAVRQHHKQPEDSADAGRACHFNARFLPVLNIGLIEKTPSVLGFHTRTMIRRGSLPRWAVSFFLVLSTAFSCARGITLCVLLRHEIPRRLSTRMEAGRRLPRSQTHRSEPKQSGGRAFAAFRFPDNKRPCRGTSFAPLF